MTGPKDRSIHAVLVEVEPCLFRADYRGVINQDDAGAEVRPDSHIGTDADGVKGFVEALAKGMGYDSVVWESPRQD